MNDIVFLSIVTSVPKLKKTTHNEDTYITKALYFLIFETLKVYKTVSFCAILMKLGAFFVAHRVAQNAPNFIKIAQKLTVLLAVSKLAK